MSTPILYYALGGGLGHLTRSLAIVSRMGELAQKIRILGSSSWLPRIANSQPFILDSVPLACRDSLTAYLRFLKDYLKAHQIQAVVMDSFPYGLLGEWRFLGPHPLRLLIARFLRWKRYRKRIGPVPENFPAHSLAIEPLDPIYEAILQKHSRMVRLKSPISSHWQPEDCKANAMEKTGWAVVHSGNPSEQSRLLAFARARMKAEKMADAPLNRLFPEAGIFPAQRRLRACSHIVCGAGYNMTALAASPYPGQRFFLFAFERRFDDQQTRLERFESGNWLESGDNGAGDAADWLKENLGGYR
jgi:hypothetical protein